MTIETCIEVVTVCPVCGEETVLLVPCDGYYAWLGGECIQNALPSLTADEREMLISGICPECWGKMFA